MWISRCDTYFQMYAVSYDVCLSFAFTYCSGPAAIWLQSVEYRIKSCGWKDLCSLLLERFGRDDHDLLIRQPLHIRQLGSVTEYITQFSELIDQLAAYESPADPRHYTMHFIDGLRPDLRSIFLLQRPPNLDTACTLAAL